MGIERNLLRSIFLIRRLKEWDDWIVTRSFGREFQMEIIRFEKKNLTVLVLARGCESFKEWPLRDLLWLKVKKSLKLRQLLLCTMLKHITRSAIKRLCSRLCSLSWARRSPYGRVWQPGIRLVKCLWTPSICKIWPKYEGDQVVEAYSTSGLTKPWMPEPDFPDFWIESNVIWESYAGRLNI